MSIAAIKKEDIVLNFADNAVGRPALLPDPFQYKSTGLREWFAQPGTFMFFGCDGD